MGKLTGKRPSATSVLQGAVNAAVERLALELAPMRVNTVVVDGGGIIAA